jgi:hypothetical protein
MGKPDISFAADPHPKAWKTLLATVAYPTPWVAIGLAAWAIHHIVVAPFTNDWRWFYAGFFGGPVLMICLMYRKIRYIRSRRAKESASSP